MSKEREIVKIYPLTMMQEGMLFHFIKDKWATAYFDQYLITLRGEIDKALLEKSLNTIIKRHDVLRTVFVYEKIQKPKQVVLKDVSPGIDFVDISHLNEAEEKKYLEEFKKQDREKGFDLIKNIPMRVFLFKSGPGFYRLLWSLHHITMDGWSFAIFLKELIRTYQWLRKGESFQLKPVRHSFSDYVRWLEKQDRDEGLKYWQEYLEGYDRPAGLPKPGKPPDDENYQNSVENHAFKIHEELTAGLTRTAASLQVTINSVFQALWGLLLQKYNNTNDVVFGTVVSGRPPELQGIENMIGLFINTIPVRIKNGLHQKFSQLIVSVHEDTAASKSHEYLPLAEIQAGSLLKGHLIDHILVFENYPVQEEIKKPGKQTDIGFGIEGVDIHSQTNYDFNIIIIPGKCLSIKFVYNSLVYDKDLIERTALHFVQIARQVKENTHIKIKEIEIITAKEKRQILMDFNQPGAGNPPDWTIQQLFVEQVERTPGHVALVSGEEGGKARRQLTYRELNKRSQQLANLLIKKGVQPETIVAIMMKSSHVMVTSIIGILKAGGAYLPIDPQYPQERINYMLSDSNARILLKKSEIRNPKSETNPNDSNSNDKNERSDVTILNFEHLNFEFVSNFDIRISNLRSSNLAYIIYTSGSTGKPKGVEVQHQGVVNTLIYRKEAYGMKPGFVSLQLFSSSFDGYVTSIFTPLISGAKVVSMENEEIKDIEKIRDALARNNVTHFISVPPLYATLIDLLTGKEISTLKVVTLAGDRIPLNVLEITKRKSETLEIVNEYGVTEFSVMSTMYRHQERDNTIKIGHPIGNTRIYILAGNDVPQPIGIPGQLCLAGVGSARGYLNNPEQTKEKFDRDLWDLQDYQDKEQKEQKVPGKNVYSEGTRGLAPLSESTYFYKSSRSHRSYIYKSGDLARWHSDGNIEFLGRIDQQVKIRGFRIELGEIENQLLKLEGIKEAVAANRLDESGQEYLCGYFVSKQAINSSNLKTELLKRLPDYMVPDFLLPIAAIPLTPSGKANRNALPSPGIQRSGVYAGPQDSIEKKLVDIWYEVLGKDASHASPSHASYSPLGIDDNFFDLGGHSLKATILISKIHKELKVKVPLAEVFKRRTIRELSAYIKGAKGDKYAGIITVEKKDYYELSSAQKRVYFLQQLDLNSTVYNMPLVLPQGKDINKDKLGFTLRRLISRHESLRTSFIKLNEAPVQKVHDEVVFEMAYYDLATEVTEDTEGTRGLAPLSKDLAASTLKNFIRPFDLSKAPLMRSGLIRLPGNHHAWIVDMHHIISDGTSHMVLAEDFMFLYAGKQLPMLRLHYKDFSQWQNRLLESSKIKTQENYWLGMYTSPKNIPRLNLPLDFKRPEVFTFAGGNYRFKLEKEKALKFKTLGSRYGATLYMNMMAALDTLFYKYTGQTDIIIGSGIAGRHHADLQDIIGMFVNTLAVRNYPESEKTYETFLNEVVANSINAFENQDVQFEELVDKLDLERDPSRNPLFDISMVVQNFKVPGESVSPGENLYRFEVLPLADKTYHSPGYNNHHSKFDMTFFVRECEDDIYVDIEYYTGIFKQETIKRLVSHLKNLIASVIREPSVKLKDIDIIPVKEKEKLLHTFNDKARDYPADKTIHELFAEQVERTPGYIALHGCMDAWMHGGGHITYLELNKKSNQLADYLYRNKKTQPDDRVGLLLSLSLFQSISILGILKSGAAYVPIDPRLPVERIKYMINDAGIATVISEKRYIKLLNRLQWECDCFHSYLCVDSFEIHEEDEVERSELMAEELWNHVGETAADDITASGWVSSYTGKPFSRKEMDEYADNILEKLEPLFHPMMRVLEIGCASGFSMYRIAPKIGTYYGTDLSPVIIEKNKKRVEKENRQNIKLSCLAAHEIDKIRENNFHLVIINSVIQCFHGHNYLRKVIRKCIDLLADNGYLFLGDIMDQDKKDILVTEMKTFKYTPANRDKGYNTKTDFSAELFLSSGYWKDLGIEFKEIQSIEFSDKIHTIENELTKFRYDVLIKINKKTFSTAKQQKQKYQDDMRIVPGWGVEKVPANVLPANLAYIIYTSGTTGKPKGVEVQHQGVVNTLMYRKESYGLNPESVHLQLFSYSFDGFVTGFFTPIISGARVILMENEEIKDIEKIRDALVRNNITHFISVPALYSTLIDLLTGKEISLLKVVTLAGDRVPLNLLARTKRKSETLEIVNEYGVTESSVMSTIYRHQEKDRTIKIGHPIENTRIYIVNGDNVLQPIGIPGQLCLAGVGLARGYLNNPELTKEKFDHDLWDLPDYQDKEQKVPGKNVYSEGTRGLAPLSESTYFYRSYRSHMSYIYKTGDLARWLSDGNIEFLGRIDQQVKIRGFRIELEEIENQLLELAGIKKAVVIDRFDESGHKYLCGYFVSGQAIDPAVIKNELSKLLPDYMVPGYLLPIEMIPLTPSGKVNRNALPSPGIQRTGEYSGPRDSIGKKLAAIWCEVLGRDASNASPSPVGIDDNFFELGGHSLKATILTSKIHKELKVKVPLTEVFKRQTIRKLSAYIKKAKQDKYVGIEAEEKKEYYELSSAQKRLYFLQQLDLNSTVYNMPLVLPLGKDINKDRLESTLRNLISRHESLRTSFIKAKEIPYQQVHHEVEFEMEYYEAKVVTEGTRGLAPLPKEPPTRNPQSATALISSFIRPFDLSRAPLMRLALIRLPDSHHIWLVDIHHIVSDGTSHMILAGDFMALYTGKELPRLRLYYKDFSRWQNRLFKSGKIKYQENYWLQLYPTPKDIPRLNLPLDFKRPEVFTFAGGHYSFMIENEDSLKFKVLGTRNGATLYINILAALDTLFYKYTGQTDIIIGSGIAGRPHAELQDIIGMFVNTLAMRNYPKAEKTYETFLKEVSANCIDAFENQDLQFEELVDKLDLTRNPSRNPLFDIAMIVQNFKRPGEYVLPGENDSQAEILPLADKRLPNIEYKNPTSKVDITFFVHDRGENIHLEIEYYTGIFKKETIKRLESHLGNIVKAVIKESSIKLKDIDIITGAEKQQVLYTFNDTAIDYPDNKGIHELFEVQVEKTPDYTALLGQSPRCKTQNPDEKRSAPGPGLHTVTYRELNEQSNQLAHYLYISKAIRADERIAILMEMGIETAASILGILKASGAYVPIDPSLPEERKKHIIKDSKIGIILSEKQYIRDLNQLQWESQGLHSYLCIDSHDVHKEEESETSKLMDKELWHHVGETATDDITAGGWISSYTGEPFSQEEMDEYGDNILEKLTPLLYPHMRVLEIGCASGISMYRIAPRVGLYYGTDLSAIIIAKNRKRVQEQGYKNIRLAALAAHEIHQLEEKNFDLIIINSVIQAFHGHNYLRQVIKKSIDMLGQTGYLFIGDIMDQEKKYSMIRELTGFNNANTSGNKAYTTKTDFSEELFIPRGFLTDLQAELEEIEEIQFSNKIYTLENELTKFRYDALIRINKKEPLQKKREKQKYQDDLRTLFSFTREPLHLQIPAKSLAYVIYTSGTTGKPKGVAVEHKGIVNYAAWRLANYDYREKDVTLQLLAYSFDGFASNFYPSLFSGGKLILIPKEKVLDYDYIAAVVRKERVTNISLVPGIYEILLEALENKDMESLRFVVLAGEKTGEHLARESKRKSPETVLINEYGPTEAAVTSAANMVMDETNTSIIGRPIWNVVIYILGSGLKPQPLGVAGEICISGVGLARGYLNNPELTIEKFCLRRPVGALFKKTAPVKHLHPPRKNFLLEEQKVPGKKVYSEGTRGLAPLSESSYFYRSYRSHKSYIYKTGDLARWHADGNIEFLGRIDQQVKIRGFRIELREIENQLLELDGIKEVVVVDRLDESGQKYLCAYFVSKQKIAPADLKNELLKRLPGYMVPAYLLPIETIPLTPSGKVNRNVLPPPGIQRPGDYISPRDSIEKNLAAIWCEVLGRDTSHASPSHASLSPVGIDDNFFELGGHSLKATILTSKIHKELKVKVPLTEVFKRQTIRELSAYIKRTKEDQYASIEAIEKKEYYELSSAQKRVYFLQQLDLNSIVYNMPLVLPLGKDINKDRLEFTLRRLISRHESLGTSFIKLNEAPVQKVHDEVVFEMSYFDLATEVTENTGVTRGGAPLSKDLAASTLKNFIRPFDLSKAPLIRSGLIRLPGGHHTWIVDMHHIISDGTSHMILAGDFMGLYAGKELTGLRLHYKDFSRWQNRLLDSGKIIPQENYWLELYPKAKDIPRLNLPLDFKRPEVFTFAGDNYSFMLEREEALKFKILGSKNGATLYMNILAALNVLFYKYTSQTDIIIGSGIAGRPHADLQQIIGMFVNTLAMRNYPESDKTYETFLNEVVANSVNAFENQDVQFEELVDKLDMERDPSRNPLFDISMVVQNFKINKKFLRGGPGEYAKRIPDLRCAQSAMPHAPSPWLPEAKNTNPTAKFDITFFINEAGEDINIRLEYYTGIFKEESIKRLARHFKNMVNAVVCEPSIRLKDIDIVSVEEKQQLIHEFNSTGMDYPADKSIHELCIGQAERTPDYIALHGDLDEWMNGSRHITYGELNKKSNQLAHYLYKAKSIQPEGQVGILLSQSFSRPIAILGVLKAGAAYIPIDPSLPTERVKYMIEDASLGVVISEKKYVKDLNRLQWECHSFHSYLCLDSFDIQEEDETEPNELMDRELWRHVAETASDDITAGGWISSYTGKPFSKQEMDEYGDNILEKLSPLLHPKMRILEIGCASGISMYRIAAKVGFYYGTDLSANIIEKNKKRIEEESRQNIKLACLAAHEINKLEDRNFHLVIINSVIQCFHGHNYLRKVIRKSIDLLADEGYLFLGDIMDLEKKESMIRELKDFKYANKDKKYTTKTDFSSELFLSRGFWNDLGAELEEIQSIQSSNKIHTIENELTKFRYDVIVKINKKSIGKKKRQKQKHQDDLQLLPGFGSGPPLLNTGSYSLAYLIYTSGTTGKPKGVMIEHGSLVNLCYWHNSFYQVSEFDHATLYAGFGFDASVWELFPYLITGASLYIVPGPIRLDIEKLFEYFERYHISISFLPTQFCEQFLSMGTGNSSLRILLTGGDKLHTFVKRNYALYNNYGPTENTVVTTSYLVEKYCDNIPIGKPIDNSRIYILAVKSLHVQPVGVSGELCIGGTGLARGYLNNPELTNKKLLRGVQGGGFLEKSPPGRRGQMIYKTGDLARWLSNGNIEFLGRIDQQVKIRGFRIELGEIESQSRELEGIKEAVVVDRLDENGDKYLCGYFVSGQAIDPSYIKTELSKQLPGYMIPNYFLQIETIPLTPGGKVNRSALPSPIIQRPLDYAGPLGSIEKKLVDIWCEVLGRDASHASPSPIGIDDNFFNLGGHSLKATILTSKIHKELNINVPLAEVFKRPTIRGLSLFINASAETKYTPIEPTEKKEYYPLSSAQARFYILQQVTPESTAYNMAAAYQVRGNVEKEKFEDAFKKLTKRHETLRTSFQLIDGQPVQQVHREASFTTEYYDLTTDYTENTEGTRRFAPLPKELAARNSQPAKGLISSFTRPFDLSRAPLLRLELIKISPDHHILMFDMHHIITDGTSISTFLGEFIILYTTPGTADDLPLLSLQYKDFSWWQYDRLRQGKLKKQEAYWWEQFPGELQVLNMPLDFPRPPVQGFAGDQFHFTLEKSLTRHLNHLIKETGTTLFMLLLTVYNILLSRYTSQEDIVIGTTIAGRTHPDLENIIGLLIETLALRNYPLGKLKFSEFLNEVKQTTLKAYENQDYPFKELIKKVWDENDLSRNPVFDAMLMVQNFEPAEFELEGLRFFPYEFPGNETPHMSKVDFTIEAMEAGEEIDFSLEYCTCLFKRETMERLVSHFINISRQVVSNPEIQLSAIEMINEEEKKQILEEFNHKTPHYKPVKMVHELFADQVEETPDNIALVGPVQVKYRNYMTNMTNISYKELNEKSDQLAHLLIEKGVQPDTIVGIIVERSVEMVIDILGILKAGGAYLPIDPEYPAERIQYMLADSGTRILLSELNELSSWDGEILHTPSASRPPLSRGELHSTKHTRNSPLDRGTPQGGGVSKPANPIAYIIYTSGSTGRPKGVMVEHRNLTTYINAFKKEFDLRSDDTVVQQVSYSFDAFVEELYPILLKGGKLAIPGRKVINDIPALYDFIVKEQVTMITCSPQLLNELNSSPGLLASLRILISGGDRLKAEHIGNLLSMGDIYNTYGPTEATVCATYYRCPNNSKLPASVSIGKPISNYRVYILDRYNNILPISIPGELCIAGSGVTRGYLNRPGLTADKFIKPQEKTKKIPGKRIYMSHGSHMSYIYKTGDLARWLKDGNIDFLGRIDRQVKIRGYRIELGEIESQLTGIENIKKAVVVERERKSGQNFLAAYVVCEGPIEVTAVKSRIARQLPDYMIPTYIVEVDEILLTFSGKVDQKRLPRPDTSLDRLYAPPSSNKEKLVEKIWKDVLEKDRVGLDDNFFDLGGTSLDIFKVNTRIKKIFKKQIPTVMMFKHSTIRSLANYIEEKEIQAGIPGEKHKEMINAAASGKTMLKKIAQKGIKKQEEIEKNNHINGFEIAVIGMAAQFPGAGDIHEFWENLKNGVESISFFTDEELQTEGIEAKILKNPNYIKARGTIPGVDYFDSSFFGYASTEAQIMDPQVRIFLQCVWHGLEEAGYDPFSYDRRIGLYAGASPNLSWEGLASLSGLARGFGGFMIAQLADKDFMCTHISYKLNLNGPSVSIQTACSTSLAAIHWAVRGLLTGECEMALAGGVSIAFPPKQGYLYQEGMIFSPDGHNKTFDAEAAGSVFGDGVGVVVLKPLAYATRDRDHIYAIIKGSAINNDGYRKVGYTAPSIDGQAEVIKSAQLIAEVEPGSITYVEAHGTATPLGDTVEIEALKQAFNTSKKGFCGLGAVKSNVGHLYSASGMASFIKTILALKHRLIPPSLHFKTPNPGIDFENTPFYVNKELKEWKSDKHPLRAGVSSFGIGGTNVHVILEEPPVIGHSSLVIGKKRREREYQLILLSAKTPPALEKQTENLVTHLKKNPGTHLADVAYTLQIGRKHFPFRRMFVYSNFGGNSDRLPLFIKSLPTALVKEDNPLIVFMFCGQGSQYVNMGIDLYRTEPIFHEEMDRCFEILNTLVDVDLKEILYPHPGCRAGSPCPPRQINSPLERGAPEGRRVSTGINQTEVAQPLIFALEYALAKLLMCWGIQPWAMIGYSFGEYIAACISGVFSLEEALKLITIRSKLIGQTPAGAMTSVPLPVKKLKPLLHKNLSLAIINGPTCIVSGGKEDIEAFENEMKKKRIMCVPLNMSQAIHSRLMAPIRDEFENRIRESRLKEPRIPYISNVTAGWVTAGQAVNPKYWGDHLCSPVRFSDGLKKLLKEKNIIFIEIGAGRILGMMVRTHPDKKPGHMVLNTVKHQQEKVSDDYFLLEKIGQLWLQGQRIDWTGFYREQQRYRLSLPGYPFEGKRYWLDSSANAFKPGVEPSLALESLGTPGPPGKGHDAPGSKLEQAIAHIWQEFLGVEPISIHDNFFQLNGNSLIALQLIGRLNEEYQVEIPMSRFYEEPTIAHLAPVIKELKKNENKKKPQITQITRISTDYKNKENLCKSV